MEPPKAIFTHHDQVPYRPSPHGKSPLANSHTDTDSNNKDDGRPSAVAPPGSGFLSIFDSRTEVADWEKFKSKCIEAYGASAGELDSIRFVFDPRCEGYVARNLWLKLREAFPVLASAHAGGGNPQAWRLGEIAGLLALPSQPAFHAWLERESAAGLLAGRPLGTFLWRFGTAGHLSLAVVCPPAPSASSSRDSDPVRHWRIVVKGRQRLLFTTSNSQQRVFRTLTDIEEHYRREPLVIGPGHSVLLTAGLPRAPYPPPPPAVPERSSSLSGPSGGTSSAPAPGPGSQSGSRLAGASQRWAWPAPDSPAPSSPAGSRIGLLPPMAPQPPPPPPAHPLSQSLPSLLPEVRGERAQSSPPPQLFTRPPADGSERLSGSAAPGAGAGILPGAGYQRRLPAGAASPLVSTPPPPWALAAAAVGRDGYRTSLPSSGSNQLPSPLASAMDSAAHSPSSLSGSVLGAPLLSLEAGERAGDQYKEINYSELVIRYPPVGGGAFGMVYRGTWRGADVAVKQLHAADLDLDELRREARVWQRLAHHPNVAHLVGACTRQYPFCLVSDYYAKGSLFDILIKRREAVEWPHVLHVLLTAAVGIAHLHKEQVIHRDVSARNILVQVVDDQWIAKVSDFGLARVKSSAAAAHSRSAGGAIKWMSPELLLAHRYSERSDAYSFGITLWECFYRSEPFPDVPPAALALQVCRSEAPLRPDVDERCPAPYAELMRSCWAHEPDARPPFHDVHERLRVYYEALRPPT